MIGPSTLVPALVGSGVVGAVLGALVWRERPKAGATCLSVVFLGLGAWALAQALALSATAAARARLGVETTAVVVVVVALSWFLFAVRYTGYEERLARPVQIGVAVPAVAVVVLAVAGADGIAGVVHVSDEEFGTDWGPLGWAAFGYVALLAFAGSALLLHKAARSRNVYRERTFLILAGGTSVLAAYVVSVAGLSPTPSLSLAPLVFLPYGVVTIGVFLSNRLLRLVPADRLLGLFDSRFRNIAPIARDLVIERMGSGVIVFDDDNRIVDLNPLAREILGTGDRRIVGRRLDAILDRDAFDGDPAFFRDDERTGSFDGVWVTYPDGRRRCYDVVVTDLADHRDDVSGRVAIVHDVTEQQRRKQELTRRTAQLERQNERLDEFASLVSHDLRNPLQVLRGSLDGAQRTDDPAHLERGREAVERMETLIDDVLTLAREGRTVEEPSPVDVGALAREAWRTVETGDATLIVADDTPTLRGDEDRLRRVFENLYRNALEHGPDDAAVLTLRVGPLDDGAGFSVADDGPGIPSERRDEVFEHGFSTDDGTGLGLSIVESIVEAHGGTVTVAESEDGGARFEIRLDPTVEILDRTRANGPVGSSDETDP